MPVLGVNRESSLSLIPGSHLWSEQETIRTIPNSLIDGIKFSVPAVIFFPRGAEFEPYTTRCRKRRNYAFFFLI